MPCRNASRGLLRFVPRLRAHLRARGGFARHPRRQRSRAAFWWEAPNERVQLGPEGAWAPIYKGERTLGLFGSIPLRREKRGEMEKSAALGHRAPTAAERWESAEHGDEQRERECKSERHPLANPRAWSIFFFWRGVSGKRRGKKKTKQTRKEKPPPKRNCPKYKRCPHRSVLSAAAAPRHCPGGERPFAVRRCAAKGDRRAAERSARTDPTLRQTPGRRSAGVGITVGFVFHR